GRLPVVWHRGMDWRPDWSVIRALFRFGLPTGVQGIAMNVAGVLLLRFIGSLPPSAQAQAAYAAGYSELFSFIPCTAVGLMRAGDTRSPLYISIASQIVVPLGLCSVLQATRGLHAADIWTAILLGHITRSALSVARFRQGKWRSIQVEMQPARP